MLHRSCSISAALVCGAVACGGSNPPAVVGTSVDGSVSADTSTPDDGGRPIGVSLLSSFDLPRSRATRAISATVSDEAGRSLVALLDREPVLVRLTPSADYRTWTVGEPMAIEGRAAGPYDGEGLAKVGASFYAVTNESGPTIERLDAAGKVVEPLVLPAPYAGIRPGNKGIESLTASPSGKHLFFANEQALTVDGAGPSKDRGTRVRIDRRDLATGDDVIFLYLTDPLGAGTGGDMGVSEMLAISDTELLVLERGFQSDYGNTVRIYRVSLAASTDALPASTDVLPASARLLEKSLVVDLGSLDCGGCGHPSRQPNPILDNYEALALGPKLADGRRVVFVTSDDNAQSTQVARVLTLAIPGIP